MQINLIIPGCALLLLIGSCKDEDNLTVSDIDGNKYHTVTIGTQIWMVENLKVTRYRNGDPLPNVMDDSEWGNFTLGAYCNMENDESNSTIYGRLYNWYAVNDSRGLAPDGWHIPNTVDWATLISFLGGEPSAGAKLKDSGSTYWCAPNAEATNESGFTGLPGGVRTTDLFLPGCELGLWWTATEFDETTALNVILFDVNSEINAVNNDKLFGMSVRCIRD